MKKLEDAIVEISMGNSILILGAGFNHNLTNSQGKPFPLASDLKKEFEIMLEVENSDEDIETLSDVFLSDNDSNADTLIQKLEDWFRVGNIKDESPQSIILNVPWKRIYTVNYDNVAECISSNLMINRTPITISKNVRNYISRELIIHLNGSVDNLSKYTLKSEFKLSSTSYLQTDFINSDWYNVFKNDVENANNIFFIGVSMKSDLDIGRVIMNKDEYKNKIYFIDKYIPEDKTNSKEYMISTHRQRSYGNLYNIGLEKFANMILKYVDKNYNEKVIFKCFTYYNKINFEYKDVTGISVRDLLVHGDINESLVSSHSNSNKYLIHREIEENIYESIKSKKYNVYLLIGQMANGKTCIINNLKNRLKIEGNVFTYDRMNDNLQNEIEEISHIKGNKYIFIENYYKYLDIIEKLSLFLDLTSPSFKLILTGRPFPNESMQYELPKILKINQSNIKVYSEDIDILTNKDILSLDKLIHKANFLETEHNKKNWDPISYYQRRYKRQIYNILIELIHNKQVSAELKHAYKEIAMNKNTESIIIASSICTVIGTDLSLSNLFEILKINDCDLNLRYDKNINLFVSFSDKYIKNKSSILSNFVLSECTDPYSVLSILRKMVLNAENCIDKQVVKNIRHDFISSSNIYSLLYPINKRDRSIKKEDSIIREYVLEYYNDIKELTNLDNNIFFWVQFAMACMDYKDYDRAMDNLKVAIDIVDQNKNKGNFFSESVQVTTQLARCTLEQAIFSGTDKNAYQLLISTNDKLVNLIKNEEKTKHYLVYKQMGIYKRYYAKFKHTFKKEEIKKLYNIIDGLEKQIGVYVESNLFLGDRNIIMIKNVVQRLSALKTELLKDYSFSKEKILESV